jgi:putative MFS transporter
VGIATFFDAYTVLAPLRDANLFREWKLTPTEVGIIISAGYAGSCSERSCSIKLAERTNV